MGGLLGGGGDGGAAKRLEEQNAKIAKQEKAQAQELASRRKVASRGGESRTLFNQVLGTDAAIGKKTKLGG